MPVTAKMLSLLSSSSLARPWPTLSAETQPVKLFQTPQALSWNRMLAHTPSDFFDFADVLDAGEGVPVSGLSDRTEDHSCMGHGRQALIAHSQCLLTSRLGPESHARRFRLALLVLLTHRAGEVLWQRGPTGRGSVISLRGADKHSPASGRSCGLCLCFR